MSQTPRWLIGIMKSADLGRAARIPEKAANKNDKTTDYSLPPVYRQTGEQGVAKVH
jgi:hypothetical protein